jgi:aryl-alcohol dehydrogenase-like predicted oxidoreductase
MSHSYEQASAATGPHRREFLVVAGALGAGAALPVLALEDTGPDRVPLKPFGKTKEKISAIGIGGHAIGLAPSNGEAVRIIQEAIDAGVTFMDNAWEYHKGRSEEWMGDALKGRRDKVFLMTKVCTHGRDKKVAMEQLEQSLKRLKTDHLDLWQVHEVVYDNDPDLHFA